MVQASNDGKDGVDVVTSVLCLQVSLNNQPKQCMLKGNSPNYHRFAVLRSFNMENLMTLVYIYNGCKKSRERQQKTRVSYLCGLAKKTKQKSHGPLKKDGLEIG